MANTAEQLVFKLVIDGKEAIATLDTTQGKFVETGEAADKAAGGAQGYVQNLGKDFDGVNVTVNDLIERLNDLKEKLANTPIGGEAYQRWAGEIKNIEAELNNATTKIKAASLANEGLVNQVMQYNQVNDVSVAGLSQYITTQGLSIETIQKTIQSLDVEIKTLAIDSDAWKQKITASTNLKAALGSIQQQQMGMNSTVKAGIPGQNSMNMAMMQFGYALNDSQMFMVNARMGMMGIANNIPMIVQGMQQAKEAAKGNASMMKLFTASLMGGGGLIIGINALMFALQFLPGLLDDTSKSMETNTKDAGDLAEKVRTLKASYEDLVKSQDDYRKNIIQTGIAEQEKILKNAQASIEAKGITLFGETHVYSQSELEAFKKQIDDAKSKIADYNKQLDAGNKLVNINVDLLKGLVNATNNGSEGVKKFAAENKLSEAQLGNLISQLKDYDKNVTSISGGLAKELSPGMRELALQFGFQKDQITNALNVLKDYDKTTDRFSETKKRVVDKYIEEELRQQQAAELAGKNYEGLLNELTDAEKDYATTVEGIKNAHNQKELDALNKFADLTKARIELIRQYVSDYEKEMDSVDEAMKKYASELDKQIANDIAKQQKFSEDKKKFFDELPAKTEADPYEKRKKELDAEKALTVKRAEIYGATEEQITNIHAYYTKQRESIDAQSSLNTLNQTQKLLGQMAGLFNKQTAAYKVLAIAQVWIETYKAVAALYAPPPVGVGPALAPFMTAAVIAMGAVNTANIAKQDTTMKGYETGGRLPKGKAGIFEGTKNELVAPEEDFMTIANDIVTRTIDAKNYFNINSGSNSREDLRAIKDALTKLNQHLDNGIKATAYYDDYEARKIYNKGDALNRKSGI